MSSERIQALFLEYYSELKTYATAVLKNEQSAEDAVMETFKAVCRKEQDQSVDVDTIGHPGSWLRSILRNVMSNSMRIAARRTQREISIETFEEDVLFTGPDLLDLHTKYAGIIADEDLDLVIYIATTKATYSEAAHRFGIKSADACRKRYKKALKEIHRKLTK